MKNINFQLILLLAFFSFFNAKAQDWPNLGKYKDANSKLESSSENENRVVLEAKLVDGFEQVAYVVVGLRENIGETTVTGLTVVVGVRVNRFMSLGIGQKHKERLVAFGFAPDEVNGLVSDLPIDRLALLATVNFQLDR